eukprot:TRINITY_DN15429_c0_g2_i1.p1 TRINITY_DN15429_c0_g2~~TRINITY_DN15429_c0_g2_i1.p1  ORF type:complete len:685 (-),score=127.41 TRINITY_DN15429_c0_g2_i1:69-2060(-)
MVVYNVREHEGGALLKMLDAIRRAAQGSSKITVRILAATDHDGVCASQILVSILRRNQLKFTLVPVTANSEVLEHIQQLAEDTEVRSLILLNCGASLDLQKYLEESQAHESVRLYVIDAHRPMILSNLSSRHERVVVIDDDPMIDRGGMAPPIDSESDDDESSEEGGDDDEEEIWDPNAPDGVQRPEDVRARKRARLAEKQERLRRKRHRITEYYRNSYYASPVAMSLFKMAKQIATPSQDIVWVAAVALTGYYELGLLDHIEYERTAFEELKEALDRVGDMDRHSSQGSAAAPAPTTPTGDAAADDDPLGHGSLFVGGRMPTRPLSSGENSRLRFEIELRLTLYKHWTLEESMMHSSYFNGTMELHRDKGQRALKNFFATAGIQPADYRQLYSGMKVPIRKSLHQKFRDHGRAYGLTENRMFLHQFVRELGVKEDKNALFLHELSACDSAFVVTSLLSSVPSSLSGSSLEHLPHLEDGHLDTVAIYEMERQAMVDNFWRAFDAVLCKERQLLLEGIHEAVLVAQAVQRVGRLLKDSKAVQSTRWFRWCKIEQPQHHFRHVLSVRRLAVWLLHVLFAYRPGAEGTERPLLLIVHDRVRETYLCVGAVQSEKGLQQDEFGDLFRKVIRTDKTLRFRYDTFDKSCIEVAADDFDRFWEILCASRS